VHSTAPRSTSPFVTPSADRSSVRPYSSISNSLSDST
jgi:hypothetical protein